MGPFPALLARDIDPAAERRFILRSAVSLEGGGSERSERRKAGNPFAREARGFPPSEVNYIFSGAPIPIRARVFLRIICDAPTSARRAAETSVSSVITRCCS